MMQIKFQVFDTRRRAMGDVVALWWSRDSGEPQEATVQFETQTALRQVLIGPDHGILRKFTGLLDVNGKEIYEGDIITYGAGNLVIFEERGAFRYKNLEGATCLLGHHNKDVKVIGNIHENPELLKGGGA